MKGFAWPGCMVVAWMMAASPVHAQVVARVKNIGAASSKDIGVTALSVTVPAGGVARDHLVIVSIAMDPVAGTVTVTDGANTYSVAADVTNTGTVRTLIIHASITAPLAEGQTILTTFPAGVTAKAVSVTEYSGLMPVTPFDASTTATGNGLFPSSGNVTTQWPKELLVGAVGTDGPPSDLFVPFGFTMNTKTGTTGGDATSNISVYPAYREVTTTGGYAYTALLYQTRSWGAAVAAYRAAPTQLAFASPPRLLVENVCSGPNDFFTVETRSVNNGAVPPTGTTVFRVTTSSPTATVYSDATCSTPATDFTLTTTTGSATFYIRDTAPVAGGVVRVDKISGPDTLSSAEQAYNVNGTVGFAGSNVSSVRQLTVTVGPNGVPQGDRIVVAFGLTDANNNNCTVSVADTANHTYGLDHTVINSGRVRQFFLSAYVTTPLVQGNTIVATITAAPGQTCSSFPSKAMVVVSYSGLARTSPVDVTGSVTNGNGTSIRPVYVTTTRQYEIVVGVAAERGPRTDSFTAASPFRHQASAGSGTVGTTDVTVHLASQDVSATGTYPPASDYLLGTISASRRFSAGVVGYKAAPSRLMFTNTTVTTTAGTCSSQAFTLATWDVRNRAIPPTGDTQVNLTSSSPTAQFFLESACTTPVTSVTFLATQSTRTIYVRDTRRSSPTHLLTATAVNGPDLLSSASQPFVVQPAAPATLFIALPGETFVEGTGITGSATTQVAGVSFNLAQVTAADTYLNIATSLMGPEQLVYSGPGAGGDGSLPLYTTAVVFDAGQVVTPLSTTLFKAETVQLQVTASGSGISGLSNELTVTLPQDTTAATLFGSSGYAYRGPGTMAFSLANGTGGNITEVVIPAPPGWVFDAATTSMTGWSATIAGGQARFTAGVAAPLAHLATATFTARNAGGLYPNVAVDTDYAVGVQWNGFNSGQSNGTFQVLMPIGEVVLPAVSRSAAQARPTFYWSNSDVHRVHSGVVVVKGNDVPVDGQTYAAGDPVGASTVVCVGAGSDMQCTEGDAVPADDNAGTYAFFNVDASLVHSSGITISVPARPTAGFVYKHQALGLTPPGVRAASLTPPGFAVFGAQDRGLYFVRPDGTEQRRAVMVDNAVIRRSVPLTDATSQWAVFTADNGSPNPGLLYRAEPTGVPSHASTGIPVSSGVTALMTSSAALNAHYKANGPALLFGSNGVSNNFIRAFQPNLSTYWTLNIGDDAMTHEGSTDSSRAYMFMPVGAGGGGVYGFDLSVSPGAGAAPAPPGWPGQKILAGTLFKSQCRMAPSSWNMRVLFCGSHDGRLFAINADSGAVLSTAGVTGSVQGLVPVQSTGVVVYTTRSGRVGRVYFDGTQLLTSTTAPQPTVFETVIPGVTAVSTALPLSGGIYVGGNGRLHKLDNTTGAVLNSVALDGNQVSEVAVETTSGTIFVQTSGGTIWGVPMF